MIPPTPESDITNSPQSTHEEYDRAQLSTDTVLPPPPQKRKAGRKPLYKTAQERRDRNRRAQLAFRARRNDYLAKLEDTCRSLENVVIELQESNRMANDALARERSKVRYLEQMLHNASTVSWRRTPQAAVPLYPSVSAISVPMDENSVCAIMAHQMISDPSLQEFSLVSLEQQISPTISTSPSVKHVQAPGTMNQLFHADSHLGMLPFPIIELRVLVYSCRCIPRL